MVRPEPPTRSIRVSICCIGVALRTANDARDHAARSGLVAEDSAEPLNWSPLVRSGRRRRSCRHDSEPARCRIRQGRDEPGPLTITGVDLRSLANRRFAASNSSPPSRTVAPLLQHLLRQDPASRSRGFRDSQLARGVNSGTFRGKPGHGSCSRHRRDVQ